MPDKHWIDEIPGTAAALLFPPAALLASAARQFTAEFRSEYARNHSRALHAAVISSGLSREELAERVQTNPRLVPIVTRVLFEAGMTGQDEILDALGAALGAAAAQPDRVDEVELILLGLPNLRREHLVVLRVVKDEPPTEKLFWTVDLLTEASGLSRDMTRLAVTGLSNAGFGHMEGGLGQMTCAITELGRNLLEVLERFEGEGMIRVEG